MNAYYLGHPFEDEADEILAPARADEVDDVRVPQRGHEQDLRPERRHARLSHAQHRLHRHQLALALAFEHFAEGAFLRQSEGGEGEGGGG